MIERTPDDVTFPERVAMGTRMELALASARIRLLGGTVLHAAKAAADFLFSGDPYGVATTIDGTTAQVYYQPPDSERDTPTDEI